MVKNTIKSVHIEEIGQTVYIIVHRRGDDEGRYYKMQSGSDSHKRVCRVLNTEIKLFRYSLESFFLWGAPGNQTLRFKRNILPDELSDMEPSDRAVWLHILYPALFPMPESV